MSEDINQLIPPEEALSRFQKPDTAFLGLDISTHDYEQPRYGFMIHGVGFLISPEVLCEVMKNIAVFPIPNTKHWVHGLVNLRGNLIPVFDLSMLLGLSDEPMVHDNLLIIDKGPEAVGILVESLPQQCDMSNWSELATIPNLPAGLSDCVSSAFSKGDEIWLGLNHKEFFSSVMDSVAR